MSESRLSMPSASDTVFKSGNDISSHRYVVKPDVRLAMLVEC
jgi:hypothetical protein